MSDLFSIRANLLDGTSSSLGDHKGKALLIVNVASECGLTPQYTSLQKLFESYKDRGFEVLGFPCNQFGAQEPGSAETIRSFCTGHYGVSFPMFEKVDVNGPERHDLYTWLISQAASASSDESGDITWNFEKFLVDTEGNLVARFAPSTVPDADEIVTALERCLPA